MDFHPQISLYNNLPIQLVLEGVNEEEERHNKEKNSLPYFFQ